MAGVSLWPSNSFLRLPFLSPSHYTSPGCVPSLLSIYFLRTYCPTFLSPSSSPTRSSRYTRYITGANTNGVSLQLPVRFDYYSSPHQSVHIITGIVYCGSASHGWVNIAVSLLVAPRSQVRGTRPHVIMCSCCVASVAGRWQPRLNEGSCRGHDELIKTGISTQETSPRQTEFTYCVSGVSTRQHIQGTLAHTYKHEHIPSHC